MRVLITGDRSWVCRELAEQVIRRLMFRYGPDVVIVHGGATGVDEAFATSAERLGVNTEAHPVTGEDWQRVGKRAGPLRNAHMVALGADICIAVHRSIGESKGTKDCARRAIGAGIPTYLIDSDLVAPKRIQDC
jgi:hypothetical protein